MKNFFIGIDLGAGQGTKIGLFYDSNVIVAETIFPLSLYGNSFQEYSLGLAQFLKNFLIENDFHLKHMQAIGIATAGILRSDGSFKLIQNVPHFNDYNLKTKLEEIFEVPVGIDNDANAGGLAEWSVLRVELLYWVFGGGWGGAWISKEGVVRFPSHDWDGNDANLHYTNEPGYAIPLDKFTLKSLFYEVNASYERMERILLEDLGKESLRGPEGNNDTLRAETILSGPGRCRLFRAIVGDDDFYERFLDIHETENMADPSIAGKYISKLSSMRVEAAINTDRLYGKILAHATRLIVKTALKDSLPEAVPICLGGKPSYALPYFGPSAQRIMGRFGLMNYLRPSVIDERGLNANLVGAAVLAQKAAGLYVR